MPIKTLLLILILLAAGQSGIGQGSGWSQLIALEATRSDVERLLGKPETRFDTYGLYDTSLGRFSVWYSTGICTPKGQGLQYDVPANKMTRLYVRLEKPGALTDYFPQGLAGFAKTASSSFSNRHYYSSSDDSKVIETIQRQDGTEFVYTITIQPSVKYKSKLCSHQTPSNVKPLAAT